MDVSADGGTAGGKHGRASVIAVVLVVAVDIVLRIIAPVLPAPILWPAPELQSKAVQMHSLGRAGGADAVFVGSSLVDVGLDPSLFPTRPGGRSAAYNAALLDASIGELTSWVEQFVVPMLKPRAVVVGISGRELNGGNPNLQAFDDAFARMPEVRRALGRETTLQTADREARSVSYLFRYRSLLRQPHALWRSVLHPADFVDLTGAGMETTMLRRRYTSFSPLAVQQFAHLDTYSLSQTRLDQIAGLVRWCAERGVATIVVNMPMTATAVSLYPHGLKDYEAYSEALNRASADAGAGYVATGIWPEADFGDPAHLNGEGARRLSRLVAARLAAGAGP